MATIPLPHKPSLDRLRRQARDLQKAARRGDDDALALVREFHPHPDPLVADPSDLALHEAQLTLARSHGFSGWPALVHHVDVLAELSVDPSELPAALSPADRFSSLACLRYDRDDAPPRWDAAAALLHTDPALTHGDVWAAAAACDVAALRSLLADDPTLANRRGGPFGWAPLLYLTYSRAPLGRSEDDVLAAARLLLDAGADPNAGYLWRGLASPFTALTGVFGEGEMGAGRDPRHPHSTALATLLLDRGAHPLDHQTLYNRMFGPDDSHLEVLFAHGLAEAPTSPWEVTLGEAMESRDQVWERQVAWAAEHGFADRLALLARHGIDTSGVTLVVHDPLAHVDARDENGATALHAAAHRGDLHLIRQLLDAGADPTLRDDRFDATPLGWAEHGYMHEAAALLRSRGATT